MIVKNIPVFTCGYGAATLILREIPVFGKAYILLQTVFGDQAALIEECASFCRAAGAEQVYVRLDSPEERTAFACQIWELERIGKPVCAEIQLTPVDKENVKQYISLYNRRFIDVIGAAHCDEKTDLSGAWLWLQENDAVGLGQMQNGELRAIATSIPGQGKKLAGALLALNGSEKCILQVASNNLPALGLYESLGFEKTKTLGSWYLVL